MFSRYSPIHLYIQIGVSDSTIKFVYFDTCRIALEWFPINDQFECQQ